MDPPETETTPAPAPSAPTSARLAPLPYQEQVRDYLKEREPRIWDWFRARHTGQEQTEQAEEVRLHLLKTTYRIERETHPALYDLAEAAAARLGVYSRITFYQSQNAGARGEAGRNAALAYLPGEAHLVLQGPVTSTLSETELKALVGHELAHFKLYEDFDGEFRTTDDILAAMTNDAEARYTHQATYRLFRLYSEVFCDRGACLVTDDVAATIRVLVKVETGANEVSCERFLRQAEEIFLRTGKNGKPAAAGRVKTEGVTHPESFIRARALGLWSQRGNASNLEVAKMIEGSPALEELDLLAQTRVERLTRRLIDRFLSPRWMRSAPVLAHAHLFFEDYTPPEPDALGAEENEQKEEEQSLAHELETSDNALQDYYCYVLLDFATCDRSLEEAPLAAALLLCEKLGLGKRFGDIAGKELRLKKKALEKTRQSAEDILAKAQQVSG